MLIRDTKDSHLQIFRLCSVVCWRGTSVRLNIVGCINVGLHTILMAMCCSGHKTGISAGTLSMLVYILILNIMVPSEYTVIFPLTRSILRHFHGMHLSFSNGVKVPLLLRFWCSLHSTQILQGCTSVWWCRLVRFSTKRRRLLECSFSPAGRTTSASPASTYFDHGATSAAATGGEADRVISGVALVLRGGDRGARGWEGLLGCTGNRASGFQRWTG